MATPPPSPPATPPPPPPAQPPPPPAQPPKPSGGSNKVLFIVLGVLLGIVLLIGGCVTACTYFAVKKGKELAKNPQLETLALVAEMQPGIEVVSKDTSTGKLTLRNKKTGEVETWDTNKYSADNIGPAFEQFAKGIKTSGVSASSESSSSSGNDNASDNNERSVSPAQAAALAANTRKLPDYMSTYSGANTLDATTNSFAGVTVITYSFETSDSPETVTDFYDKKFTKAGFSVLSRENGTNDAGATTSLMVQRTQTPAAAVSLTVEIENQKTQVKIVSTGLPSK